MTDTRQLDIYADAILFYFGRDLLSYEQDKHNEYMSELGNAIDNREIEVFIPLDDRAKSFEMALDNAEAEFDDYDESMDGDFDSAMASAGMGTDEDYGYYGENVIRDANELLHLLNESNASRKAKKLGLVHIGFGNYAEEKGSSAKYKTVNGKLKKVGGTTAKKQKVSAKATTSAKKKEEPKKKKVQSGVTDLRRVSGEKFTYEFKKDGRKYKFTLNKKERKDLKDTSIMSIIKTRLKKREEKEKTKQFKKGKPVSSDSK